MGHPEFYTIAAVWLPRLLGLIYFFAFVPFLFQIRGLLGKNGILPVNTFLHAIKKRYPIKCYHFVPTLFWFNSSNNALMLLTSAGTVCSLLLFLGVFPPLMLLLLYVLYLSIVSAGQEFLSFGWEGFLLDITSHAFLLSFTPVPNIVVWISLNLLLLRFHFQAGIVKFQSRDPNWRNFSANAFHYLTQPLPNVIAWYMHKLPLLFHKISCFFMFFAELVVPFGIFFGEDIRLITFILLFSLQFFIWFTGNLSFLNHLTAVFCIILISDHFFAKIAGISPYPAEPISTGLEIFLTLGGFLLLGLQIIRICSHLYPYKSFDAILRAVSSFHLANRYGIFAVMTTKRYEIVIEGSHDEKDWKEYTYKYKPSEIDRYPRRVSPYQPRLDWQTWFLPFTGYKSAGWFISFLTHLLMGTPEVVKLLRGNPFPEKPPKYIRARLYDYEFSSREERKKYGRWWNRKEAGFYTPTLSLRK